LAGASCIAAGEQPLVRRRLRVGVGGQLGQVERRQIAAGIQPRGVDVHAVGEQRGQRTQERRHAVALAHVGGDGRVRTIAQDVVDQPGEHSPAAGFEEHAGAGGVHRLDLVGETHGAHQVIGEPATDFLRVGAVGMSVDVAEHGLTRCGHGRVV
jgi:hypothetical protein